MTWLKVDDATADHPAILDAGDAAVGAWLRLAAWSARHCTDGMISGPSALRQVPQDVLDRLVAVGLLARRADG